jgi:SAM-dependent methyltransferase
MWNKNMDLSRLLAAAFILIAVSLLLYCLWLFVPIFSGLPWLPTANARVRRALELAQVRPGEVVYDLGSGDGRVLLAAARFFGARAVGIEISPLHCLAARILALTNGVSERIEIRLGDFYSADLRDADVVFAFMTSRQAPRLMSSLPARLRSGARVVTVSFDFDGWMPARVDRENLVFLYEMPPAPGSLGQFLAQENAS